LSKPHSGPTDRLFANAAPIEIWKLLQSVLTAAKLSTFEGIFFILSPTSERQDRLSTRKKPAEIGEIKRASEPESDQQEESSIGKFEM